MFFDVKLHMWTIMLVFVTQPELRFMSSNLPITLKYIHIFLGCIFDTKYIEMESHYLLLGGPGSKIQVRPIG